MFENELENLNVDEFFLFERYCQIQSKDKQSFQRCPWR